MRPARRTPRQADAKADAEKSGEDVVDADFEELDEDDKKKSA